MQISRLFVYPIKSCAGTEVQELALDAWGAAGDRRFVLADEQGQFLTQRQFPVMQRIEPRWDGDALCVSCHGYPDLWVAADAAAGESSVQVWKDQIAALDCGDEASAWFSAVLDTRCRLLRLPQQRFTDDRQRRVKPKYTQQDTWLSFADGFPLLVINQASLDELSDILGRELEAERFRPNVVLNGALAWDEYQWQRLQSAEGALVCCKPCERCVIPTRSLLTLEREADVLNVLKEHCRVDGKILFGQNALIDGIRVLRIGDAITPVS